MNERRRLQGLTGFLLRQPLGRQLVQLVVDQRQKLLGGVGLALVNSAQNAADLAHES